MIRSPLMNIMTAAAFKAGKALKRDLGEIENLQISLRGPEEMVKVALQHTAAVLREELRKGRPDYGLFLEGQEYGSGKDPHHCWEIAPMSGTINFLHALPFFAISVAVTQEEQPIAAIVYNPATDEVYLAEKGRGTYQNNRRLRVSARRTLSQALLGCHISELKGATPYLHVQQDMLKLWERAAHIRCLGGPALNLAYVAAGYLDGYWAYHLPFREVAAGLLLVREAGGFISFLGKKETSRARAQGGTKDPMPAEGGRKEIESVASNLSSSNLESEREKKVSLCAANADLHNRLSALLNSPERKDISGPKTKAAETRKAALQE